MQRGRPKYHDDTSPQHPTSLSVKALDLLRLMHESPSAEFHADNFYKPTVDALKDRHLIHVYDDESMNITDAGRALIEKMGKWKK